MAQEKTKKTIKKKTFLTSRPILNITLKSILIVCIIVSLVYYSDSKGYFNPNNSNNHTKKKWDSFYEFTKNNNVDILLLGNSHLYSGINPKNLSNALGVNAFILASPGTNIADSYFGLKEALKKTNPKLIVIETYGINDFNPYELKDGALSDQIKSFYARKDLITKITSTPYLFKLENYIYAWSNTIRNHDFIFKDSLQLANNLKLIKETPKKSKKLYLGRFVRFQKGIDTNTIAQYDYLGAPVKGKEYNCSAYAVDYTEKIVELCNEKNINLIFLTLPMYHKHIENYDIWNAKLGDVLNKYPNQWLNMQNPYDSTKLKAFCFENTYNKNQHMTYNGSLIATYKLANFINDDSGLSIDNRREDVKWNKMFYGQEGYFENNSISNTDKLNKTLCKNFESNGIKFKEVIIIDQGRKKNKILIAKINKSQIDPSNHNLILAVVYDDKTGQKTGNIKLEYDLLHESVDQYIFKTFIKESVNLKKVKAGKLFLKNKK